MITKVEVINAQGDLLSLPLDDYSSGLALEDVGGLDPVKATITSTSFANQDGTQYNSARREARNLTMKIGMFPDYSTNTVRDLRNRLYAFLMPKTSATYKIYDDSDLTVTISGRVESLDAPLFVKEPEANLSIICFDPDFIDLVPLEVDSSTVTDSTNTTIPYPGTVEVGVSLVLNVNRTLGSFSIYHTAPDGSTRTTNVTASLVADDVLTINTVTGAKGASLNHGGAVSSLLWGLDKPVQWIELQPGGDNYIRVVAAGAAIPYSVVYTPRYGGL